MKIKTPTSIVSPTSGAEKVVVERNHRTVAMDLRKHGSHLSVVKTQLTGVETIMQQHAYTGKRQTVMSAKMDGANPAFLGIDGSSVVLLASPEEPFIATWADGFDDHGAVDCVRKISENKAWQDEFARGITNYLYIDIEDENDTLTFGHTPARPIYGEPHQNEYTTLNFEGADGSTEIVDSEGNTWTACGNACIKSDQFKFGTSSLYLDGSGDFIYREMDLPRVFTMEGWFYPTAFSNYKTLFRCKTTYSIWCGVNATGHLTASISTNGTSWNVASSNAAITCPLAINTWNHVAVTCDGTYVRYWANGHKVLEYIVNRPIFSYPFGNPSYYGGLLIGAIYDATLPYVGYVDAVSISPDCYYGADFVPLSMRPPYSGRNLFLYARGQWKMYDWEIHTYKRRLFVGEVLTDADGAPVAVRHYALNGVFVSPIYDYSSTNADIVIADNIGTESKDVQLYMRQAATYSWYIGHGFYSGSYSYGQRTVMYDHNNIKLVMPFNNYAGHGYVFGRDSFFNDNIARGQSRIVVRRSF